MQSEWGRRDPTPAQLSPATEGPMAAKDIDGAKAAAAVAAEQAETTWRRIDAALSPIIGPLGMAALFKRSLFLARTAHPDLGWPKAPMPDTDAYADLRDALTRQDAVTASRVQAILLRTFHDLLSSLIGASLTERLLRSAAAFLPSGDAAQEPPP